MIMITHDLGVIAEVADDVVVMYAGAEMESATRDEIFYELPPSLHRGPAAIAASLRRRSSGSSRSPGSRRASSTCRRVPVPPALPVRHGPLPDGGATARAGRAAIPHHLSACWLPRTFRAGGRTARVSRRGGGAMSDDVLLSVDRRGQVLPGSIGKRRAQHATWCTPSTASASRCGAARRSAWWARPDAASRPWPAASPGSST